MRLCGSGSNKVDCGVSEKGATALSMQKDGRVSFIVIIKLNRYVLRLRSKVYTPQILVATRALNMYRPPSKRAAVSP